MLICNRCSTTIPAGARFCPACGDPVTAGDAPGKHVAPSSERVKLVCPHYEDAALYAIPSHGVGELACAACANPFHTSVVRIRSKRSAGNKQMGTRSFTVRVEDLDGRDDLVEFIRPSNEDFELRARDLAAFSSIDGWLTVVQNLTVGRHMRLVRPRAHARFAPGCAGAILLWMSVAAGVGAVAF